MSSEFQSEPQDESDNPDDQKRGWLGWMFGAPLPLETETTRFILVNALDIFMTYLALRYSSQAGRTTRPIGEGNPLANFFIGHWGSKGMVYFKMLMVGVVLILAQIVARKSIPKARRLLNLGTIIVAGVVIYSLTLLLRVWVW